MANNISDEKACRALLIEDDDLDRRAICRALSRNALPFECDYVSLLSNVKEHIDQVQYDIIITDMNLPDSSGLDTVTSLLTLVGKVPIVVLSGTDDDVIALEAVHIGAQDYIPKQYIGDTGLINRTLRHAMERHQLKLGLEETRDRERFLAHYDQCTSLPNRFLLLDRLQQAMVQAQRNQEKFALFFVDLDHFKNINDSIGHNAGDQVLRTVSERMQALVRDSDTVARFGGDEFVLILQRSDDNDTMAHLAEKLITAIKQPIHYGHHLCSIGASIGIACYPRHGYTPELLIKNADIAMYEAKNCGRNQVHFFNQTLFEQKKHFFSLEKALREALNQPDASFELHFQPRVELGTDDIRSVEALIRWDHPTLGNISPAQFIPLAEDIGAIEQIDEWVLEKACQILKEWGETNADVRIGVNISGRSFNRAHFVTDLVEPLLKKYGIDGNRLEMEITEGVLLANTEQVYNRLNALKQLGIGLAIDDFGTGFSSLNYLNRFPIDTLKIDGSFICDHNSAHSEKALLKAIVALGKALELKVVAECIETHAQMQYLLSLGCHEGQGYYWAKPSKNWVPHQSKKNDFAVIQQLSD